MTRATGVGVGWADEQQVWVAEVGCWARRAGDAGLETCFSCTLTVGVSRGKRVHGGLSCCTGREVEGRTEVGERGK